MGTSQSKKEPPEPWAEIGWGQNETEMQFLRDYNSQVEDRQLRILLYGQAGAGKSSFINSVQSVIRSRFYRQALADNVSGGCFTSQYKTYRIQKEPGTFCRFVFNDIKGLNKDAGVLESDVILALKGHVRDRYTFNAESPLAEGNLYYNPTPNQNDKVHVLVCVVAADTLDMIDDKVVEKIKRIRAEASRLNIPQVAVLTKIDLLCPEVQQEVRNVYRAAKVKDKMTKFSTKVGIPMDCIFPVKNYHEERKMNSDVDSLILSAMKEIVTCGDDYINIGHEEVP